MRRRAWIAWAVVLSLWSAETAYPNVAIPRQKWTQVRMVSEDVRIALSPTRVEVVASFLSPM